jgi:hypothetical protein
VDFYEEGEFYFFSGSWQAQHEERTYVVRPSALPAADLRAAEALPENAEAAAKRLEELLATASPAGTEAGIVRDRVRMYLASLRGPAEAIERSRFGAAARGAITSEILRLRSMPRNDAAERRLLDLRVMEEIVEMLRVGQIPGGLEAAREILSKK